MWEPLLQIPSYYHWLQQADQTHTFRTKIAFVLHKHTLLFTLAIGHHSSPTICIGRSFKLSPFVLCSYPYFMQLNVRKKVAYHFPLSSGCWFRAQSCLVSKLPNNQHCTEVNTFVNLFTVNLMLNHIWKLCTMFNDYDN